MTAAPLVSVVVPAYNRAESLGAAISSVLKQSYPAVEAVVVDDGSSDSTLAIARAYEGPRVRVVAQDNAGVAAARNAGIEAARGEYIATCDSDDRLLPDHVQRALDTIAAAPFPRAIAASCAYVVDGSGLDVRRTTRTAAAPPLADQRLATLQANWASYMLVAPRRLFDEIGGYSTDLRSSEDWELWLRALYAGWSIAAVDRPTALYEMSGNSLTHDRTTMTTTEQEVVRRLLESCGDRMSERERAYCERRLATGSPMDLAARADAAIAAGDTREGARLLALAHELNPRERKLAAKAWAGRLPGGHLALGWYAKRS